MHGRQANALHSRCLAARRAHSGSTVPTPDELPATAPVHSDAIKRRALATVAFTLFLDLLGFGIILPVPWQRGQVCWIEKKPCCMRT